MGRRKASVIHINRHVLMANKKHGRRDPVVTCKTGSKGRPRMGDTVVILDDRDNVVAAVVYRPGAPLSCGAHAWVHTRCRVAVLNGEEARPYLGDDCPHAKVASCEAVTKSET